MILNFHYAFTQVILIFHYFHHFILFGTLIVISFNHHSNHSCLFCCNQMFMHMLIIACVAAVTFSLVLFVISESAAVMQVCYKVQFLVPCEHVQNLSMLTRFSLQMILISYHLTARRYVITKIER